MTGSAAPIGDDDLQAFIDERLDPARRTTIEAWLAEHPDAADSVTAERRDRDLLRARLAAKAAEPIPARLRIANIRTARTDHRIRQLRALAAAVFVFAAGAALGALSGRDRFGTSDRDAVASAPAVPAPMVVADDAGAAYRTFVVEVAHPVEVDAAHEAHLTQWLSKRLGRRIEAPDLTTFDFRLMGGRLLPSDTGAAAQLMYEDGAGKRLTVYVQAAKGDQTAFLFRRDDTTATFAWIDAGFGFAVTAATDREHLLPIAEAIYHRFETTGTPAHGG